MKKKLLILAWICWIAFIEYKKIQILFKQDEKINRIRNRIILFEKSEIEQKMFNERHKIFYDEFSVFQQLFWKANYEIAKEKMKDFIKTNKINTNKKIKKSNFIKKE